jgi:hypothetical protein
VRLLPHDERVDRAGALGAPRARPSSATTRRGRRAPSPAPARPADASRRSPCCARAAAAGPTSRSGPRATGASRCGTCRSSCSRTGLLPAAGTGRRRSPPSGTATGRHGAPVRAREDRRCRKSTTPPSFQYAPTTRQRRRGRLRLPGTAPRDGASRNATSSVTASPPRAVMRKACGPLSAVSTARSTATVTA